MKWTRLIIKLFKIYIINPIFISITLILTFCSAFAEVPLRISVKFILDSNGSRPTTGNMNQDVEVINEIDLDNEILEEMKNELMLNLLEILDVAGIDQYYNADIVNVIAQLRNDAQNNPILFAWRNDAINIYINNDHGGSAGVALYPPDNDIIMLSQNSIFRVLIHEIGHSLSLGHTHEEDFCSDTITDDPYWSRDDIALNNFGNTYINLTQAQKDQVDMVYENVMSYHFLQFRLSPCQMDRMSNQGYKDWTWLYGVQPYYVNYNYSGLMDGSPWAPYRTLQDIFDDWIYPRIFVLQEGNHYIIPEGITIDWLSEIVTRFGPSTISHSPDRALYTLPNVEESKSPEVRVAIKAVGAEDSASRKAIKEGEQAASLAATPEDKVVIRAAAKVKEKLHKERALKYLLEAENYASGDEKIAIQLELAQRYMHSGNCESAIIYYELVANATDQNYLREEALKFADMCREELKKD